MKTTMVIPSYWTRERALGMKETDAVYDHPTPLDEEGTLKRVLESVGVLEDKDFNLIVIAVAANHDIAERVEDKVSHIIASAPSHVPTYLFSHSDLRQVHQCVKEAGGERFCELLSLKGYSNIRNLCLFLPHVMGSDIAVLIDDDEVFEDPAFMRKAREYIGRTLDGEFIGAVAGYYLQPDGEWRVTRMKREWMHHWDKVDRMNEAFEQTIGRAPRLKKTSFVFGGNMVIHRDIFTRIPFDPNVTRGEDIDFLINMRMFGHTFFLDNTLSIKHLPPPKSHPTWKQLREDIYRFLFERAKLRGQDGAMKDMCFVSAEELSPYPGAFLKDDLEEKITNACLVLAEDYRAEGKENDMSETLKNIDIVRKSARAEKDAFHHLVDFQKTWEDMMMVSSEEALRSVLMARFVPGQ